MIDYKKFIETVFYLKDKQGVIRRFELNDVQSAYYKVLTTDYPSMEGIRENILKGRQFGISTMWEGVFVADFIMSAIDEIQLTNSDIYSYKDEDTKAHFERVNIFLNSWLLHSQGGDYGNPEHRTEEILAPLRKSFLKVDTTNYLETKNGTQIMTKTASAKVSGRGSTKQNIHWTEPAFYPNTDIMSARNLMTGAEEQVLDGFGKVVRESTGNLASDYYAEEYYAGKDGRSPFKSRFIAWYNHAAYAKPTPKGWELPSYYQKLVTDKLATPEQCYWHYMKTRHLTDKEKLREYPTFDREAFLFGGNPYFNADALLRYQENIKEPKRQVEYASAL